jgi:hypothetical protein
MDAKQIIFAAALGATLLAAAGCAEDSGEEREAPASEQSEGENAEYED